VRSSTFAVDDQPQAPATHTPRGLHLVLDQGAPGEGGIPRTSGGCVLGVPVLSGLSKHGARLTIVTQVTFCGTSPDPVVHQVDVIGNGFFFALDVFTVESAVARGWHLPQREN
jgi:hypothetical protein